MFRSDAGNKRFIFGRIAEYKDTAPFVAHYSGPTTLTIIRSCVLQTLELASMVNVRKMLVTLVR